MKLHVWLLLALAVLLAACRANDSKSPSANLTSANHAKGAAMSQKILILVTSHDRLGETGEKTGFWLEELAAPYRVFVEAGAHVDIASPKGGKPPADPRSTEKPSEDVRWFLANPEATRKLDASLAIDSIQGDYDAYFVVGGHGVMWDLATHPGSNKLLGAAFDRGKVVAAVCHGPGALINVRTANGDPLVKGRRVAGFSNEEERAVKLDTVVPFALESRLRDLGGLYERGPNWSSFAIRDGRLVTGQNPQSSAQAARETLAALSAAR
ncbi:type 1 glutamine amidotransferase domain-containing protein [Pendulispora albinea]|uniref:Type 1 glutamine amidotransferase domain-containing protein n=1 Tax=Pendulispora albinea TaxID=2741071 RepID=A0ABZ2LTJ6_9BACT